jgi:hypothetical protein
MEMKPTSTESFFEQALTIRSFTPPLLFFLFLVSSGCSNRAKAPPLTNEAFYQNEKVQLRFLAPPGWVVRARTDLPPGALLKPVLLISYAQSTGEKAAEFAVFVADVPDGVDLGQYQLETRIGPQQWKLKPGTTTISVGGQQAARYEMTSGTGKEEFHRETTAIRRGGRVVFFIVTVGAHDSELLDQANHSIAGATWTE